MCIKLVIYPELYQDAHSAKHKKLTPVNVHLTLNGRQSINNREKVGFSEKGHSIKEEKERVKERMKIERREKCLR